MTSTPMQTAAALVGGVLAGGRGVGRGDAGFNPGRGPKL